MLKISFSGVPGCGRSSLAKEVRKILALKSRTDLIEDINRKNPFDDHQRSSFESQFFYISTQINEENKRCFSPLDYVLSDQSILDQWVSWLSSFNKLNEKAKKKQSEHHHLMETIFRFWIRTYDLLFLIRVSPEIYESRQKENRLRQINGLGNEEREKLFLKTIQEEKITVIETWNNTTVDETALKMIQSVNEFQAHRKVKEPKNSTAD